MRRHVARCRGLRCAYLVALLHGHTVLTTVDIVARDGRAGRAAPREIKALADKHDGKVARVICSVCRAVYVQARRLAVGGQRVEDTVDRDVVIVALAHAAEDVCRHPRAHLLVVVARARLDAHDVAVGCDALARELPCHAHIGDARLVSGVRLLRRRQRRDLRDARRIAVVDDRILAVVELIAVHRFIVLGELERYF